MQNINNTSSSWRIRFLVDLPSHSAELDYSLNREQAEHGSIILAHVPLHKDDLQTLQMVYRLCKTQTP